MFHLQNNLNKLEVEFGSGLSGHIPSRSPLSRNLLLTFVGDSCSEVESPASVD